MHRIHGYIRLRVCVCVSIMFLRDPQHVLVFKHAGGSRSLHETRANGDAHAVLVQTYLLLTAPGHLSAAGRSNAVGPCF